jgi:pimeloyl-ACP methyl ester carboxylesterase
MWSRIGTDDTGLEHGKTWYIGGAGPVGDAVGALDVPRGLRNAGYRGAIEVYGWQSETLRDQVDRSRNEKLARQLAGHIQKYLDAHPGRRVNIIALSAGTGIATWALESLDEGYRVGTVVFLASSISRRYDLSRALSRIDGRLYCFYSTRDNMLRLGVPFTGSVDRKGGSATVAGLYGFALPPMPEAETLQIYRERLRNRGYRREYRRYGYRGDHTDGTAPRFIEKVVAPLLMEPTDPQVPPEAKQPVEETNEANSEQATTKPVEEAAP